MSTHPYLTKLDTPLKDTSGNDAAKLNALDPDERSDLVLAAAGEIHNGINSGLGHDVLDASDISTALINLDLKVNEAGIAELLRIGVGCPVGESVKDYITRLNAQVAQLQQDINDEKAKTGNLTTEVATLQQELQDEKAKNVRNAGCVYDYKASSQFAGAVAIPDGTTFPVDINARANFLATYWPTKCSNSSAKALEQMNNRKAATWNDTVGDYFTEVAKYVHT